MRKIEVNGYCVKTGKVILDIVVKMISLKQKKCLDLLTEKGVYPYDYMNSFDKFNDEKNCHLKNNFYSRLK